MEFVGKSVLYICGSKDKKTTGIMARIGIRAVRSLVI